MGDTNRKSNSTNRTYTSAAAQQRHELERQLAQLQDNLASIERKVGIEQRASTDGLQEKGRLLAQLSAEDADERRRILSQIRDVGSRLLALVDRDADTDHEGHEAADAARRANRALRRRRDQIGPPTSADETVLAAAIAAATNGRRFAELFSTPNNSFLSSLDGTRDADDIDLVSRLAHYCGPDPERITRLLWHSSRGRLKWLKKQKYLPRIIAAAIVATTVFYMGAGGGAEAVQRHAEAQMDAAERERQARFRCERPHFVVLEKLSNRETRVHGFRCESWSGRCPGCRAYLEARAIENVTRHVGVPPTLYELAYSEDGWDRIRKQLGLCGAEYIRIRTQSGFWIVTDATNQILEAKGARPISPGEAIAHATELLHTFTGEQRPVSTSRAWKLSEEAKRPREFKRVGRAPKNVEKVADYIAGKHGCHADPIRPRGDPTRRRCCSGIRFLSKNGR